MYQRGRAETQQGPTACHKHSRMHPHTPAHIWGWSIPPSLYRGLLLNLLQIFKYRSCGMKQIPDSEYMSVYCWWCWILLFHTCARCPCTLTEATGTGELHSCELWFLRMNFHKWNFMVNWAGDGRSGTRDGGFFPGKHSNMQPAHTQIQLGCFVVPRRRWQATTVCWRWENHFHCPLKPVFRATRVLQRTL